ncbi:hypothetical protein PG996_000522 [Apiospora saccharicola]|uniref:Uncharacterized protein n=1 Tax=Apiospora saccharicola TaxID=335842 RepID=A0ABR1WGV3_9PEZI
MAEPTYGRISANRLWLQWVPGRLYTTILCTNKQVHAEASSVLYSANLFDLSEIEYRSFARAHCSREYTRWIRRVVLGYPRWSHYATYLHGSSLPPSYITSPFRFCPALILADRGLCAGLIEITLRAPAFWDTIGAPNSTNETIEAFALFDRHLRTTFPLLERICVEVWRGAWPSAPRYRDQAVKMRDTMRSAGWVLVETEELWRGY